jgi:hypothetical protein
VQTSYDFYASAADLLDLLRTVEESTPVTYALAGAFKETPTPVYESAEAIPELGKARRESTLQERHFLVVRRETALRVEPIAQQAGGTLFYVDGSRNPEAILLVPGGLFHRTCLIGGVVGMNNLNPAARRLFQVFARLVRKRFTRVEDAYVGPEAFALLKKGFRLTTDADLARGQDLQCGQGKT